MDVARRRNGDVDWNTFDAASYYEFNYRTMRSDDQRFLAAVRDHFAATPPITGASGVDLGAGANLYPAFAMLPYVASLTLLDYSHSNVRWLREQVDFYDRTWDPFWATLRSHGRYRQIDDPRAALRRVAVVLRQDLFTFAPERLYDIGTMFFVAESISTSPEEFRTALRRFVGLLAVGAPFAIAFMENSLGYTVGGRPFPAVQVDHRDVRSVLSPLTEGLTVHHESSAIGTDPLRKGYDGMILALGRKKV